MTVKTQITFRDFLLFHIKSSLLRLIVFLLILLVFFIIKESVDGSPETDLLRSTSMWFAILLLFMVIRSYFSIKFAFSSNKNIQESITYTFTDEKIRIEGETFDEDFTWNSVYKIKENKDWFLIYQSAQVMNMVPKKFLTKGQVSELRNMIKANHIKAKLRKD
ncbi:YcxB family protein [Chryseobacterium sp. SN22]|uniref:YcxB family protein n=1 Tax=Chryseobacterium sp. SN22 TaxID=2606431 RepID=UPI0011EC88FB|nr:YcxB family protein [Chryseobacterium sp. SN22]KAA0128107.1 YcxB family protein [Chryseobacterium sp. SN22]